MAYIKLSGLFPAEKKQIDKLTSLRDSLDKSEYMELYNALDSLIKDYNTKNLVGRPKVAEQSHIQELRNRGYTQEQIARELNISLSTVRRNLKH